MSAIKTVPSMPSARTVEERFHRLAAEWKEQARYLSNSARMAMLQPYQRIIGMGMPVAPLILEDLRREPHHWFWALEAITEQNPVPVESLGKIQEMANAWVEWGKNQGLISADLCRPLDVRIREFTMQMRFFFLTLVFIATMTRGLPATQQDPLPSLYAIENVPKNGLITTQNVVRIAFAKDQNLTKEVLLNTDSRFFFDFGGHVLIQDRYIVTRYGGVIDVQTKKIINDQHHGKLLGVENGKVHYLVANVDKPNGIFAFDLKTHKLERLEEAGHWKLLGAKSPDNKMSVKQEASGGPILLHHIDGTVDRLGEGFGVTYKKFASPHLGGLPFVWLDNERMLTQRGNGAFVTLDIKGKVEKLLDIEAEKEGTLSPPHLVRGSDGRIIYSANHNYLIDVKAKTATKLEKTALGNGFESSFTLDDNKKRIVYHEGKEIGRWNLLTYQARTMPGVVAFPYAEPGENLGYPKGLAVWHAKSGRWQTIDFAVGTGDWLGQVNSSGRT